VNYSLVCHDIRGAYFSQSMWRLLRGAGVRCAVLAPPHRATSMCLCTVQADVVACRWRCRHFSLEKDSRTSLIWASWTVRSPSRCG